MAVLTEKSHICIMLEMVGKKWIKEIKKTKKDYYYHFITLVNSPLDLVGRKISVFYIFCK